MKVCNKCGEIKALDEFHKNKKSKGGFNTICKTCCKAKDEKRYEEKRDKILEQKREYYSRPKVYKRQLEYYKNNREYYAERYKNWSSNNPEKRKLINERRRNREANTESTLTLGEWEKIKKFFGNSCAYCGISEKESINKFGERLHQEHIVPLSKGGGLTKNNIIPSCRSCNSSKKTKRIDKWYKNHESFDENRAMRIKNYIKDSSKIIA